MKKILILYTTVGLGHKYIALNLGYALEQAGFNVRMEDILQVQKKDSGRLINFFKKFYLFTNEHFPKFWASIYYSSSTGVLASLTIRLCKFIAPKNHHALLKITNEFKPD